MEVIRTGNTTERFVRNGIFTVMVVGFAAYCFYDWKIGYPNANLKQFVQDLPPQDQSGVEINPKVTTALAQQFKKGDTLEQIEAELGPPTWIGPRQDGLLKAIWIGPGIGIRVFLGASGKQVSFIQFQDSKYTETDLRTQMMMGIGLGALGIVLVGRMIYMFIEGAVLSDAGLKMTGKPLIPFNAMTELAASDYKVKGRVKLGYSLGSAARAVNGHVVLDDYKLREFKPIVTAICERTGFENPITSEKQSSESTDPQPPAQT